MILHNMELTIGMGRGHKNITVTCKCCYDRTVRVVPRFPYVYSIRGADRDYGIPSSIEKGNVVVNFLGRVFSTEPIPIPDEGFAPVRDWGFTD